MGLKKTAGEIQGGNLNNFESDFFFFQLTVNKKVYLQILNSVALIRMPVLKPVPYFPNYNTGLAEELETSTPLAQGR